MPNKKQKAGKQKVKVTYQGETGAYSEMAVYKFFGRKVEPVPCKDFREVFESVKNGVVPNGVVPIENSIEGSVNQNYDLFLAYDLKVCGEVAVKLAHCPHRQSTNQTGRHRNHLLAPPSISTMPHLP